MSTNTGLKLFWITELISETQVNVGSIISPFWYNIFNTDIVKRFADEPEFTNTLYLTPSHLDHLFSNSLTYFDCVKTRLFFLSNFKNYLLSAFEGWRTSPISLPMEKDIQKGELTVSKMCSLEMDFSKIRARGEAFFFAIRKKKKS